MAVRLIAGHVAVRPAGVTEAVTVTVPAKLNILANMTPAEIPVCPEFRLAPVAAIVKSPTWTVASAERDKPGTPLPEMLTL